MLPLLAVVSSLGFASAAHKLSHPALHARQAAVASLCRLNYTTDVWTGCDDVLAQFKIPLDEFITANPGLGPACTNFVPGKTYCVSWQKQNQRPITRDGQCGRQMNYNVTCVGSPFGDCCNGSGKCGSGESFCGKGSCQDGSCEGGIPYSTDGKCGRDYDYLPCPPKFGLCCSTTGQCGNQTQFCTTGCQSGPCLGASTTSSLPPSATPSSKPPGGVSPDGTCAYKNGYTCKGSKNGDCCSAAGYCGKSEYECSKYLGCQSSFGTCT